MTNAPERIWLQDDGEWSDDAYLMGEITWCDHAVNDADTEYIRADRARPKVKPLVWLEYSASGWRRGLVVGYRQGGGRETEIKRNPNGWTYGGKHYDYEEHDSCLTAALKSAKAAAQADYERRILEALE